MTNGKYTFFLSIYIYCDCDCVCLCVCVCKCVCVYVCVCACVCVCVCGHTAVICVGEMHNSIRCVWNTVHNAYAMPDNVCKLEGPFITNGIVHGYWSWIQDGGLLVVDAIMGLPLYYSVCLRNMLLILSNESFRVNLTYPQEHFNKMIPRRCNRIPVISNLFYKNCYMNNNN